MDIESLYLEYLKSDGVSIDSRVIKANQIFFALSGSQVNGNDYALAALALGARWAIVNNQDLATKHPGCVYDPSPEKLLQSLARYHRNQLKIPVIGITGSVGKTTTKELITTVLNSHYRVVSTQGNLNNQLGVPLTILKIEPTTEIAVIEMGANHIGEISELCEIAQPTHGLITRIGKAHLEGFGSLEGVIIAKSDLYRYLRDHEGTAFINDHDALLVSVSKGFEMKKILVHQILHGETVASDPFLKLKLIVQDKEWMIQTSFPGKYNEDNVFIAAAVGLHFDVLPEQIKTAMEDYVQSSNRSQHILQDTNEFILDAYNANPLSMTAAIQSFQAWQTNKKKILVLGEMKELGEVRIPEHQKIIDLINQYQWDTICLVGPSFNEIGQAKDHQYFNTVEDLKSWYASRDFKDTAFLIKASRGMALEKMIAHLIPGSVH